MKTVNELKIQLESREDLAFLKHELKTFARNNIDCNASIPDSLRDQYFEKVFQIISQNIQVNGLDWQDQQKGMEEVNPDLITELQDLQVETEQLVSRVIECRQRIPQVARENYRKEQEDLLKVVDAERERELTVADLENVKTLNLPAVSDDYPVKLDSGLARLSHLESTIPEVIAKLGRAQAVITEEGNKQQEKTRLLNRHRRVSRQFDLASKIAGHEFY